jgi:hypothetical protein
VEDSQLDTAPVDSPLVPLDERPTERALACVRLTPVPTSRTPVARRAGVVPVVAVGLAAVVVVTEIGRRAGASGRLTAFCSVGVFAVVVVPGLGSPSRPGPVPRAESTVAAAC